MKRKGRSITRPAVITLFVLAVTILTAFTRLSTIFKQPANFPAPLYSFRDNAVSEDGFLLGRRLFYDPILSADKSISCGSCHIQAAAFTHHGHDLSHGINDLLGNRNTPAIQNMAWYSSFMWDGGILDMDLQPIAPITNPVEMGDTLLAVLKKLNAHPEYPALFKKAFGSDSITTSLLMKALSQFMVMLVSADSKYDKVMRKEGMEFNPEEQKGYDVFKNKCGSCHKEPLFTDFSFRNNGLSPADEPDEGRLLVTVESKDQFRFKVPSLRNLGFTFPYMHDGRFYTLDEVLDHYSSGMHESSTLDPLFRLSDNKNGIILSAAEKESIKIFLATLDDSSFIRNPYFSEENAMKYVK